MSIEELDEQGWDVRSLSLAWHLNEMGPWKFLSILLFLALAVVGCGKKLEPVTPELDFGEVLVGASSEAKVASWKNSSQPPVQVQVDNLVINQAVFVLNGSFASLSLGPGGQINKGIKFVPAGLGEYMGTVTPKGRDKAPAHGSDGKPIKLRGKGVAQLKQGGLSITDVSTNEIAQGKILDFGRIQVGSRQAKRFKLENGSGNQLRVSVSWGNSDDRDFSITHPTTPPAQGFTVPGNGSLEVEITFSPNERRVYTDAIIFRHSSGGTDSAGTSLKGEGIAD